MLRIKVISNHPLLKNLAYYPLEGKLYWVSSPSSNHSHFIDKEAGSPNSKKANDYRRVGINGKVYAAHHLVFIFMTGRFPPRRFKYNVHHINGLKYDNRWENLKVVSQRTQCQYRFKRRKCKYPPYITSTKKKRGNLYRLDIRRNGKVLHLAYSYSYDEILKLKQQLLTKEELSRPINFLHT